jgi:hypothetical protein
MQQHINQKNTWFAGRFLSFRKAKFLRFELLVKIEEKRLEIAKVMERNRNHQIYCRARQKVIVIRVLCDVLDRI